MIFIERRIAQRIAPRLPAGMRMFADLEGGEGWIAGHTLNVSPAGALIALDGSGAPPAGAEGEVRIGAAETPLPFEPRRYLKARAVVRRNVEDAVGKHSCIAIEFRDRLTLVTVSQAAEAIDRLPAPFCGKLEHFKFGC